MKIIDLEKNLKTASKLAQSTAARVLRLAWEYRRAGQSASESFINAWKSIKKTQDIARSAQSALGADFEGAIKASLGRIEGLLSSMEKRFAGFFDFLNPLSAFQNSSKAAAQAQENIAQVIDVFGKASTAVGNFADQNANALGVAENAALGILAQYGRVISLWAQQGVAAQLSTQLMQAATVVASKTGREVAAVNKLLLNAVAGNTDGLFELGLSASVASLEASTAFEAIANSRPWEKLNEYEIAQIRTLALLEQATIKYASTAENSAAMVSAQLGAAMADFSATLGAAFNNFLVPMQMQITVIIRNVTALLAAIFGIDTKALQGKDAALNAQKQESAIGQSAKNQDALTNATQKTAKAQSTLLAGFDEITNLQKEQALGASSVIGTGIEPIKAGKIELPLADFAAIEELAEKYRAAIKAMLEWVNQNITAPISSALQKYFFPVLNAAFTQAKRIFDAIYTDAILPVASFIGSAFSDLWAIVSNVWGAYGEPIFDSIVTAFGATGNALLAVWNNFLAPVFASFMQTIKELWDNCMQPFLTRFFSFAAQLALGALSIYNNVIMPLIKWFSDTFGGFLAAIFSGAANIFSSFVGGLITGCSSILGVFQGVLQFIGGVFASDWSAAWNGIVKIFEGVWGGIVNIVKTPINVCIDVINTLLSALAEGVNFIARGLNSINFTVPKWVPGIGGLGVGFNLKTITAPKIPRLATGAVVPQNREFLAVLGDNKRETEIVSPLSTMKQALLEALAEQSSSQPIQVQLTVDGQTLASAVANAQRRGGRTIGGAFADAY